MVKAEIYYYDSRHEPYLPEHVKDMLDKKGYKVVKEELITDQSHLEVLYYVIKKF